MIFSLSRATELLYTNLPRLLFPIKPTKVSRCRSPFCHSSIPSSSYSLGRNFDSSETTKLASTRAVGHLPLFALPTCHLPVTMPLMMAHAPATRHEAGVAPSLFFIPTRDRT